MDKKIIGLWAITVLTIFLKIHRSWIKYPSIHPKLIGLINLGISGIGIILIVFGATIIITIIKPKETT